MVRTQIQITEEQSEKLKKIALQQRTSIAEVIRNAIDQMLKNSTAVSREERKKKALSAAGKYKTGIKNLARDHDDFLSGIYG